MSDTAAPTEDAIACCSFCGKPDNMVTRIVAGPGVYICDECVELSTTILADAAHTTPEESARRRRQYRDRSADEILEMLPALASSAARVEAELTALVRRLRTKGIPWEAIATAAGMNVELARQRFESPPSP